MTKNVTRYLKTGALFLLLFAAKAHAQNTLDKLGLTSSTPASTAYSLRLLSSSYTGPLVRITTNSGTSYYDVYPDVTTGGFTTNSKISASVSTYNAAVAAVGSSALSTLITAGTTNATVAIWYDQSGYGRNVLQGTVSNQPTIINSGSIKTYNGVPSLAFNGSSSNYLHSTSSATWLNDTPYSIQAVAQLSVTANTNFLVSTVGSVTDAGLQFGWWASSQFNLAQYADDGEYHSVTCNNSLNIYSGVKYAAGGSALWINGTSGGTNAKPSSNLNTSGVLNIGCSWNNGFFWTGSYSENIIYTTAISTADRQAVEGNQITYYNSVTWTGATSTDWSDATNWSTGVVPTSTYHVVIPASLTHEPILTADVTINYLEINGSVTLNGHALTVGGVLSGSGTTQSTSGSSTLSLTNSSSNTIGNLINTGTALTISGPLTVTNNLKISGTLNTGGNLTLASTCFVDGNTGSANISGNVSVQLTIPQGIKAFRCLGVPLSGAGSIASTWGSQLVSGASIYQYGASGVTTVATSANLQPKQGYQVLIDASAGAKTLSATGTLFTGNQSIPLNATSGTWNFVSNPYQSQVAFSALTKSGLYQGFYYLDPNAQVNSYLAWSWYSTGTGVSNIYSPSQLNGYIQPGQAFWVCSNAANASLTFTEAAKNNTVSQTAIFGAAAPLNRIATGLFANGKNVDGAVAVFNNNFTKTFGKEDGPKISNQGENLTFVVANADVSANGWTMPTATDELPMHLYNLKTNTAYSLQLDASQFVGNGLNAYIKDKVLGTQTLLAGDSNLVAFTTTTDTAAYSNRYSIVFGASPLPVRSIAVTATALANKQVAVKWITVGESNVANYKVERSSNGTSFTTLATASPSTSHNYSFVDATIPSGAGVYYRIKATDNTGAVSYSNVAKLTTYDLRL